MSERNNKTQSAKIRGEGLILAALIVPAALMAGVDPVPVLVVSVTFIAIFIFG